MRLRSLVYPLPLPACGERVGVRGSLDRGGESWTRGESPPPPPPPGGRPPPPGGGGGGGGGAQKPAPQKYGGGGGVVWVATKCFWV
ncbi:hypothetical protein EDE10_13110, partial [Bradyrhizobium sp. Y-H1]